MSIYEVQNALRSWIKTVSGFDDAHVYFADQKIERPAGPFVTLRFTSLTPMGAVDAVRSYTDLGRSAGTEIESRVEALRDVTVGVQVWNAPTVSTNTVPSATELGHLLQAGLAMPSVRSALDAAGVSPHDIGTVQNLGALLDTSFDGRSSFDINCYVMLSASEYGAYIKNVEITDGLNGAVFMVTS